MMQESKKHELLRLREETVIPKPTRLFFDKYFWPINQICESSAPQVKCLRYQLINPHPGFYAWNSQQIEASDTLKI